MTLKKEPLIRIVKRDDISKTKACFFRIAAILAAFVIGAILILLMGYNPVNVYSNLLKGAFGSTLSIRTVLKTAIPLLGAAIAVAPAFRMRFWNIGTEGQIKAGAIAASYFAIFWYDKMPGWLLLTVMFVAALIAGGIWGLIPAFFKSRWGTNETLFTLMQNYIILQLIVYLQHGPWAEQNSRGAVKIAMFGEKTHLPTLFGVHIGWIIVLTLAVLVFVYMKYSKHGYEITVVGESQNTAKYAGMNVGKIIMRTMFVSGAIAGIVGFIIISGVDHRLDQGFSGNGVGFTAISVAWLANLNPFVMIVISVFLSSIDKGFGKVNSVFGISKSATQVLTGIIFFCMLISEFLINYTFIFRKSDKALDSVQPKEEIEA